MRGRRAPSRPPSRRQARDPILLLGTALVLALVVLLPLALALVPANGGVSDGDESQSADTAGIGSGVGELSAAALSALHRDLTAKRTGGDDLPRPVLRVRPPFLAASSYPHERADEVRHSSHARSRGCEGVIALQAPAPSGPGPDGIPLLL